MLQPNNSNDVQMLRLGEIAAIGINSAGRSLSSITENYSDAQSSTLTPDEYLSASCTYLDGVSILFIAAYLHESTREIITSIAANAKRRDIITVIVPLNHSYSTKDYENCADAFISTGGLDAFEIVAELTTKSGFVNLDVDDVRDFLRNSGCVECACVTAETPHDVAQRIAFRFRSLQNVDVSGLLVCITTNAGVSLSELSGIVGIIQDIADKDSSVIWAHVIDESLCGSMNLSLMVRYKPRYFITAPGGRDYNTFQALFTHEPPEVTASMLKDGSVNLSQWDKDGMTFFVSAVRWGTPDLVKTCIKMGADVNDAYSSKSVFSRQPLFSACAEGRADIVRVLIEAGADVNAMDYSSGMFPLTSVFCNNDRDTLEVMRLLIKAGADVNVRNIDGETPLMLLNCESYHGKVECINLLVKAGADIHARDNNGRSILMHAIASNESAGVVKHFLYLLLKAGADVRTLRLHTPIHERETATPAENAKAIEEAHYSDGTLCRASNSIKPGMFRYLRGHYMSTLTSERAHEMPALAFDLLGAAVSTYDTEFVRFIIDIFGTYSQLRGLVHREPKVFTDLCPAAVYFKTNTFPEAEDPDAPQDLREARQSLNDGARILRMLRDFGVPVATSDPLGRELTYIPAKRLMRAFARDFNSYYLPDRMIQILIDEGVNVSELSSTWVGECLRSERERLCLDDVDQIRIMKTVMMSGQVKALNDDDDDDGFPDIDRNAYDKFELRRDLWRCIDSLAEGGDAQDADLITASYCGQVQDIDGALKNGADINARTPKGYTPLMFACAFNDDDTVKYLLDSGADVNAVNAENCNALLIAVMSRTPDKAIHFLACAGADVNAVDDEGNTFLMFAAENCRDSEAVAQLIDEGADVHSTREDGESALSLAMKAGNFGNVGRLIAAGGDYSCIMRKFERN